MKNTLIQKMMIAAMALMISGNLIAAAAVFPSSPSHSAASHATGNGR